MRTQRDYPLTLWLTTSLDSGNTIESSIIPCWERSPNVMMFRVTNASGAADVKIEVAFSNDGYNFNSYTSQDPIITSTLTEYSAKNPEEYHSIIVPSAPYIKLKVTELALLNSNVVDATIWMRELA
jgi:hypothetical protein